MLISVTFSKPTSLVRDALGKDYKKIKIKQNSSSIGNNFFAEFFTETQVFHKTFSDSELENFIKENVGKTFKSCVKRFDDKEVTLLANKKGKITEIEKSLKNANSFKNSVEQNFTEKNSSIKNQIQFKNEFNSPLKNLSAAPIQNTNNKQKNYIIREGSPVPFLIKLGVMTADGKIINSKYDKFKQINRFLEYIDDVMPAVLEQKKGENSPIQIADFGCGKSYLTFAVHYFLTQIKKLDCEIIGLDLKKDVIDYCNRLAKEFDCKGLKFLTGDIAEYSKQSDSKNARHNPDIVITLHACDTATDFALQYAIEKNAKAILSVPCCQHEINLQLNQNRKNKIELPKEVAPLFKHGLIQERIASLITDSLRAEFLESVGYKVDVMEFIDMSHTPKNILLRATRKPNFKNSDLQKKPELLDFLKISPFIWK